MQCRSISVQCKQWNNYLQYWACSDARYYFSIYFHCVEVVWCSWMTWIHSWNQCKETLISLWCYFGVKARIKRVFVLWPWSRHRTTKHPGKASVSNEDLLLLHWFQYAYLKATCSCCDYRHLSKLEHKQPSVVTPGSISLAAKEC